MHDGWEGRLIQIEKFEDRVECHTDSDGNK